MGGFVMRSRVFVVEQAPQALQQLRRPGVEVLAVLPYQYRPTGAYREGDLVLTHAVALYVDHTRVVEPDVPLVKDGKPNFGGHATIGRTTDMPFRGGVTVEEAAGNPTIKETFERHIAQLGGEDMTTPQKPRILLVEEAQPIVEALNQAAAKDISDAVLAPLPPIALKAQE